MNIVKRRKINDGIVLFFVAVFCSLISNAALYAYFLLIIIKLLLEKKKKETLLLELMLYSIILPDNYSTVFFVAIYAIYMFASKKITIKKDKHTILVFLLISLIIFSSVINFVPLVNILMSLIFYLPIFVFLIIGDRVYTLTVTNKIFDVVNRAFLLEILICFTEFILLGMHLDEYSDWCTGSFGLVQQVQLCIVMIFYVCFLWGNKKKYSGFSFYFRLFSSLLVVFFTNCWTVLAFSLVGIGLCVISRLSNRKIIKMLPAFFVIFPIVFFIIYNYIPTTIKEIVGNMLNDSEFLHYRFAKLDVYYDTFILLPASSLLFCLFGNGLGYYCSRGALACTGYYIENYSKLLTVTVSENTSTYILPNLINAFYHGGGDYGSILYRPYSSILALMGEVGYLGFALCLCMFFRRLKHGSTFNAILCSVLFASCFLENFLEYSKIIVVLYLLSNIEFSFRTLEIDMAKR